MSNVISRPAPTPITVTGSTAATAMATATLPANLLTTGKAARLDLAGTITPNATAPTVTFLTSLGGASVMATSAIACSSGSTAVPFTLVARLQATSSAIQTHWTDIAIGGSGVEAGTYVGIGTSTQDNDGTLSWAVLAQLSSTSTGLAVAFVAGTHELVR